MIVKGSSAGSVSAPAGWNALETDEPAFQGGFVLEQDEERVVAGQCADLVRQARLVDRLGDRPGRAGRGQQDQRQAAAADPDRDVLQQPAEPGVVERCRWQRVSGVA